MDTELSAFFNGQNLSDYLIINRLDRGVQLGMNADFRNRKARKGVEFLGQSSELVSFEMSFTLIDELNPKRYHLADILNVIEPKELVFSDEPDKVYYAMPSRNINPELFILPETLT